MVLPIQGISRSHSGGAGGPFCSRPVISRATTVMSWARLGPTMAKGNTKISAMVSVARAAERFRFPFRLRSSHMNSGQVEEQRITAQITDDQNGQRTSTQPI